MSVSAKQALPWYHSVFDLKYRRVGIARAESPGGLPCAILQGQASCRLLSDHKEFQGWSVAQDLREAGGGSMLLHKARAGLNRLSLSLIGSFKPAGFNRRV
ncbi:MAG TPA: hypothetical protein DCZ04_04060 [Syntrophorhabdus aromaticivorans]|nr:hypothetical protein [Syntrophorhabdus aromaticivorans]